MPFSFSSSKTIRYIFVAYWILLAYIIAALIWWFIALRMQNHQMAVLRINEITQNDPAFNVKATEIKISENKKNAQYAGEGAIFFLLIIAGSIFIHRAISHQFKMNQQQQHFIMAITHELKTPIAVTKLNLETLRKRKLEDSQRDRLIHNTIHEANRLNTLCNNMLLSSQMDSGKFGVTREEINLSVLTSEAVNDFKERFPERTFIAHIEADLFITGDLLLLQMGVNNLIDNAIKYSAKNCAVTVQLSANGNRIRCAVSDEGKGIADDEKKKVFQKFYRVGNAATKSAKGTGLGLFLTKRIALAHNAEISVTDNLPNGSTFVIEFKQAAKAIA